MKKIGVKFLLTIIKGWFLKITCGENLNKIAQSIGLSNFIETGKGEGLEGNSIAGNAVEALIGAVFLDSNYSKTNRFLNKLLKENL